MRARCQRAAKLTREGPLGFTYTIDRAHQLVRTTARGELTRADLRAHYERLLADPAFDATFRQLTDVRAVDRISVSDLEIQEAADEMMFNPGSRRAIVATDSLAFERSAVFAALASRYGQNVRVFRDIGEAERWLGLHPASAMSLRFTDAAGTQWDVWEAHPKLGERRALQDRRSNGRPTQERRVGARAPAQRGWLVFRSQGERRRLRDIPPNWFNFSDDGLNQLLASASGASGRAGWNE